LKLADGLTKYIVAWIAVVYALSGGAKWAALGATLLAVVLSLVIHVQEVNERIDAETAGQSAKKATGAT
jgi:hypothetical protein